MRFALGATDVFVS